MRIGCFVNGASNNRDDEFVTCRGEGRAVINNAFGFGLQGHTVDIVCDCFKDGKMAADNVTLRKSFHGHYDAILTYNCPPPKCSYSKLLYYVEPGNRLEQIKKLQQEYKDAVFMIAAKSICSSFNESTGMDAVRMPVLFPLPTYQNIVKQDFQDFKFDINKKDANVFLFISSWPNYYVDTDTVIYVALKRLRDEYGFNMNITMLRGGIGNKFTFDSNRILSEFNVTEVMSDTLSYLDILNIIHSSDFCITKGGWCYCGMCSFDIISLGKLMIYTTEGRVPSGAKNINDMYSVDEYCIRREGGADTAKSKIDHIMNDPFKCYNSFRNTMSTQRFFEWDLLVSKIFQERLMV